MNIGSISGGGLTVRFQPVRQRAIGNFTCTVCGKRGQRQRTFTHTVNPFNNNPDGSTKSPGEVRADVDAEVEAWEPDSVHPKCEGQR